MPEKPDNLTELGRWAIENMPNREPVDHHMIICDCSTYVKLELINDKKIKSPIQHEYEGWCLRCGTYYRMKATW